MADVRVPSWYPLGLLLLSLAALYRTLRGRWVVSRAEASIRDVSNLLAARMIEGDKRDAHIAELTARMERYGQTSVKLAALSLVVATAALVVALVAAVAG